MFVRTRTGSWAPHKETTTGKTKTGIPLYTIEQAIAKGYTPPAKKQFTKFPNGLNLTVHIDNKPVLVQDFIKIGKVIETNGNEVMVGFSQAPSQALKTYRKLNSEEYIASRIRRNDKNKWVKVVYEDNVAYEGLPIKKDSDKEGYYTRKELADRQKSIRG